MAQKVLTLSAGGVITEITDASVSSVTGTAPVVSSGGASPAISMAAATGTVDGYLSASAQTIGGAKTFSAAAAFSSTIRATGIVTTGSKFTFEVTGAGDPYWSLGYEQPPSGSVNGFTAGIVQVVYENDGYGFVWRGSAGTSIMEITGASGNLRVKGAVGFNGSAALAKPTITGSRGGNAALASLLTALASYGLITDSTT